MGLCLCAFVCLFVCMLAYAFVVIVSGRPLYLLWCARACFFALMISKNIPQRVVYLSKPKQRCQ